MLLGQRLAEFWARPGCGWVTPARCSGGARMMLRVLPAPPRGWSPEATVEGDGAAPRRGGRRIPGGRRHPLADPLPGELVVAGGDADGAAQRSGVSVRPRPTTPWLNLGIGTSSLASSGGWRPVMNPLPVHQGPLWTSWANLGTNGDTSVQLRCHLHPSGLTLGTNCDTLVQLRDHLQPPGPPWGPAVTHLLQRGGW